MTLVQLQHFLTLARLGGFVAASEALYITQPALSRSIKALEDELGQRLFDRLGRRIELTPFGQETLRRTRLLLEDAQELKNSGRRIASGDRGRFRLGLGSGPGMLLTTPLMTHMARQFPRFHIEVARGSTETLVQQLQERSLDALILDVRSLTPSTELNVEQVVEVAGGFMCRPGHPLLKKKILRFEDLLHYPIASTPLSHEIARYLVEAYGEQAHPGSMVTLCGDEISHLVATTAASDAVLLAICAAGTGLAPLSLTPPFKAQARFGLVTVARRAQSVFLPEIRRLMREVIG